MFWFTDLRRNKHKDLKNVYTNENESNSSDSFNGDEGSGSEYLPYNINDLSISSSLLDEIDSLVDSYESEKLKTIEFPNTSIKIFPENDLPVPYVPKNFNFNGEVEKSRKKAITNKRIWDTVDCCIFCKKQVTNYVYV